MKLTCSTENLSKALRACRLAVSHDDYRAHLASVWVRALSPTEAHVFATDGHWLAVARLPDADVSETGEVAIGRADLQKVLSVVPTLRKKKKALTESMATVSAVGRTITVSFDDAIRLSALMPNMNGIEPPPIHQVVPRNKSPKKHARPSLNGILLARVIKACELMALSKRGGVAVRIIATGEDDKAPQVIWSPMAPTFFALLMPMREERKRDMGWWWKHADILKANADARDAERKAKAAEVSHAAE